MPETAARPRLLLVDDDVKFCELLAAFLKREGYETVSDHTGYYTLPEPYPVFHPAPAGPSHTAKTPFIPPPLSASRRWKTSTSAASRDCGMKLFLPIPPRRDELPRDRGPRVCGTLPAEGVFHNLVWSGGAHASRVSVSASRRNLSCGLNDVSGATPATAGGTPALPYKIMHGLWGMGQMIPRLRDQIHHRGG